MINIKDTVCHEPGCMKRPNYNYDGKSSGIYCTTHKKDGMINVNSHICSEPGCMKKPSFNSEGSKKGLYCSAHKTDDMVNVVAVKCVEYNCNVHARFNYSSESSGLYCTTHKKLNMIDVVSPKCRETGCSKQPRFNHEGFTPIYCSSHKTDGMINVKEKICKTPLCSTTVGDKYEGYCLPCFVHMFPDKPNSRNYKTKERAVVEYVLKEFLDKTWVADKRVMDGCSRRRPDLCLDMGSHLVMVEVDENQHIDYDCSCENKRLMEISQDVGHRPIVFIRFNPDNYIQADKTITSCWGLNKTGVCVVKKSKQGEWGHRLACLKDQITYWIDNPPEKMVEVIQHFFDA
jgi:hypothetical protein